MNAGSFTMSSASFRILHEPRAESVPRTSWGLLGLGAANKANRKEVTPSILAMHVVLTKHGANGRSLRPYRSP